VFYKNTNINDHEMNCTCTLQTCPHCFICWRVVLGHRHPDLPDLIVRGQQVPKVHTTWCTCTHCTLSFKKTHREDTILSYSRTPFSFRTCKCTGTTPVHHNTQVLRFETFHKYVCSFPYVLVLNQIFLV